MIGAACMMAYPHKLALVAPIGQVRADQVLGQGKGRNGKRHHLPRMWYSSSDSIPKLQQSYRQHGGGGAGGFMFCTTLAPR